MTMTSRFITVKEIAKKFGLSYQVINRYSDAGLLDISFKKGNIRYYERKAVEKRMSRISVLAREGYSLMLIRKKLTGI